VGHPFQIGSVAAFRGYDQLPEALIAQLLPAFEPRRDVDGYSPAVEPNSLGTALVSGALTGDITSMGSLLSSNGVLRVHRPQHIVGFWGRTRFAMEAAVARARGRHARLLKSAGQAMVGDSQLAMQDLVKYGEE
jgi:hypothetical protein